MKIIKEITKIIGYAVIMLSILFVDSESYVMLKMAICFFVGALLIFIGGGINTTKENK